MDAVIHIANGSDEKLYLGWRDIVRNCGRAAESFEAMWRMLQQPHPENFLVGTARCHIRGDFVKVVFDGIGFDWRKQVVQDLALLRAHHVYARYGRRNAVPCAEDRSQR